MPSEAKVEEDIKKNNGVIPMEHVDVVREEKFENEGLVKCYDRQGRIVEIAFLQSGNGCTIQYIEAPARPDAPPDERIVRWKSGEVFRTWKEEGKTKFTRLQDEQEWHY